MPGFLLRLLVVALGLWLASELVPGIQVHGLGTLLGAALLLGIVMRWCGPVVLLLTLPFTVLTLGLFLLVINAAMLGWSRHCSTISPSPVSGRPCSVPSSSASPAGSRPGSSVRAGVSK